MTCSGTCDQQNTNTFEVLVKVPVFSLKQGDIENFDMPSLQVVVGEQQSVCVLVCNLPEVIVRATLSAR